MSPTAASSRGAGTLQAWLDRRPALAVALGAAVVAAIVAAVALAGQGSTSPVEHTSGASGKARDQVFRLQLPAPPRPATTRPSAAGPGAPASPPSPAGSRGATPATMVGQQIMVGVTGIAPTAGLLRRIRLGQVGGVIIMGRRSAAQVAALSVRLQATARSGGRPGLLVATDQEGGTVKRIAGPPYHSAAQLGALGASRARADGRSTAALLRRARVNVDLAPVSDVVTGSSFLGSRSFGSSPARVAQVAGAFAMGLQGGGVAATAKHFPGLGSTGQRNTDLGPVAAPGVTAGQLRPFRALIAGGVRLVMVSSASYRGRGGRPAILSRSIVAGLLRRSLGFGGVVISDDLSSSALAPYGSRAPGLAVGAGVDVLLYAGTDTGRPFADLVADVAAGRLSHPAVARSYRRILALKAALGLTAAH